MQVDFDLPKRANSQKTKPEVKLLCHGRHLENGYDIITMSWMAQFGRNMLGRCRMTCRWRRKH